MMRHAPTRDLRRPSCPARGAENRGSYGIFGKLFQPLYDSLLRRFVQAVQIALRTIR